MRGHEQIIQSRIRGIKPSVINIIDYNIRWDPEPTDVIVYGDRLLDIDLRFVADCLVTISCTDESRLKYLKTQCEKYKARQIAAGIYQKYY